ncbi:MAG TPA: hypothetical protein VKH37_03945 [Ferruginibacter sp.]|nr:hypothetical protein [Ferruginibacter sp.]
MKVEGYKLNLQPFNLHPLTVVGQFEISLSKDCQVELVETGFRNEIAFDKLKLTSKEFQTDPLPP